MKLETLLVEDGWFKDNKEANTWVMLRRVYVNGHIATSAKCLVPTDAVIKVKEYYKKKYVNKGGLKLEHALNDLGVDPKGLVALDCGASTGGFTDCLIQSGAEKVYAVDVGHGQLAGKLQQNPKVVNLEYTNLSSAELKELHPLPQIITLDLSYLSLKDAIPLARSILHDSGVIIALVKPLFEVSSSEIRKTGKINDPMLIKDILEDLCHYIERIGCSVLGLCPSRITGNSGTWEFFLKIKCNDTHSGINYIDEIASAIEVVKGIKVFKKYDY